VVFRREPRVQLKTPEQILKMRAAGLVVADALAAVRAAVAPGVTTRELDAIAESTIRGAGAIPSFIGVPSYTGPDFPASICASVNDEVVHGIPGDRVLREGDVISIDCGAILDGWHGDAAVTVPVGAVDPEVATLLEVCDEALWRGFAAARVGGRLGDISHAIESSVRGRGAYGIVEEYTGHGIGTEMHQPPHVPNFGRAGSGERLREGLVLAVEPMVTLGTRHVHELDDGWTVVTDDGRPAAHFEHTFTVTPDGPWVLTAHDGGRERLAALGVAVPARA
jgi:methionyl aminopeptidase